MRLRMSILFLIGIAFLVILGCFRPSETVTSIIVKPGLPLLILGNKDGKTTVKVNAKEIKSGKIIKEQEIQGWIAMPEEHWNATKEKIAELEAKLAKVSAASER